VAFTVTGPDGVEEEDPSVIAPVVVLMAAVPVRPEEVTVTVLVEELYFTPSSVQAWSTYEPDSAAPSKAASVFALRTTLSADWSPYKPKRLKGSYQPKYTRRRSDIYLDLGQLLHNCPCKETARYMSSPGICRLPYSKSKTEG